MIKVNLEKNIVRISGHALYDEYGKDIVCAAVSSIVMCSVNDIHTVNPDAIKYQDDGKVIIIEVYDDELCLRLLDNLKEMLTKLSEDYPQNIKIESEK